MNFMHNFPLQAVGSSYYCYFVAMNHLDGKIETLKPSFHLVEALVAKFFSTMRYSLNLSLLLWVVFKSVLILSVDLRT